MDPRRAALLGLAGVLTATGLTRLDEPLGKSLTVVGGVLFLLLSVLPGDWSVRAKARPGQWLRSKGQWRKTVECEPSHHRSEGRFHLDHPAGGGPGLYPVGQTQWRCPKCDSERYNDVGERPVPDNLAARLAKLLGYEV